MNRMEKAARCEVLIEVLQIKFKRKKGWESPRAETTWGTKSREGLMLTIWKIMYEKKED